MNKGIPSYVYILATVAIAIGFLVFVMAQTQGKLKGRERDLADIAESIGMDRAQFESDLLSKEIRDMSSASDAEADERGITSTPTVFIEGVAVSDRSIAAMQAQIDGALSAKPENETVLVEEFFDYQCSACAQFHPFILELKSLYKNNTRVEIKQKSMFLGSFPEEISRTYTNAYYAAEKQGKGLEMDAELYKYDHGSTYDYEAAQKFIAILGSE